MEHRDGCWFRGLLHVGSHFGAERCRTTRCWPPRSQAKVQVQEREAASLTQQTPGCLVSLLLWGEESREGS